MQNIFILKSWNQFRIFVKLFVGSFYELALTYMYIILYQI